MLRLGLLLLWLLFFSCWLSVFDNLMVMIRINVHQIVRSGGKWLLLFIRVFFINRNGTLQIAMILVKHVINNIFLPFWFFSLRFWFLYVQWIFHTVFIFYQFGRTFTTFNKFNSVEQESSDFKRSQCHSFSKLFVENAIFILKVNNIVPVPFCINKLLIMHIVTQGSLFYVFNKCEISIKCSEKRRYLTDKYLDIFRFAVI